MTNLLTQVAVPVQDVTRRGEKRRDAKSQRHLKEKRRIEIRLKYPRSEIKEIRVQAERVGGVGR